ncbi:hypothetical protein M0811_12861 [Anaeramoeba ignava]|uniref:Uncharacterized protein n=1 Tax=Anaeramoeba ignava TaxID=1746090 RepID=A0A9Q0R508_ANAIG|nr:hypothetical protein M0811_12861 [Anaeramoeba ignava]
MEEIEEIPKKRKTNQSKHKISQKKWQITNIPQNNTQKSQSLKKSQIKKSNKEIFIVDHNPKFNSKNSKNSKNSNPKFNSKNSSNHLLNIKQKLISNPQDFLNQKNIWKGKSIEKNKQEEVLNKLQKDSQKFQLDPFDLDYDKGKTKKIRKNKLDNSKIFNSNSNSNSNSFQTIYDQKRKRKIEKKKQFLNSN